MNSINQDLALRTARDGVNAAQLPGLWTCIWTAFAAVWMANATHELAHIIPLLLFRTITGDWGRAAWQQLIVSTGGPASTIAIMAMACVLLARTRIQPVTNQRLLPFIVGLGMAAIARFVMLAPGAITVFTGRPLPFRNDEVRIGNLIGVPANALLLFELVVALVCAAFLLWRMPRTSRALVSAGVVTGVILGWSSWFTVAVVFGIGFMM